MTEYGYEKARRRKFVSILNWFNAVSIGSLAASICFYSAYDQWKPMVWSAASVGTIHIVTAFVKLMSELP